MSLFLVGGGYDDSLVEVYDEFVSQARHHNADAPIAVVVAGPPSESADHAAELTRIVTSRWADANILTIHLDGPGTAPTMGDPATPLWAEDESFQLPDNLDALAGIIVGGGAVPSYINGLAPAAEQLSMLVRGGAPWLGFSAGAMAPCVTALAGGWKLQGRQVGQQTGAEGFDEVTFVEGLGLVSLTISTHNDTLSGDLSAHRRLDRPHRGDGTWPGSLVHPRGQRSSRPLPALRHPGTGSSPAQAPLRRSGKGGGGDPCRPRQGGTREGSPGACRGETSRAGV